MQNSKLIYANPQYPKLLREISSPPTCLYVAGTLETDRPLVAIVGTRRPTDYGRQVTYRLASELAHAGMGIVSGLAIGIDAVAHEAAVDAGGYTVAVLGSGLENLSPRQNAPLARRILEQGGAVISEQPPQEPGRKQHFPARNRIIAGLSLGVVVTEAAERSGAALTAKAAADQNREVMAVPGNITSLMSVGTNNLIRNHATPVTSAADVLAALNLQAAALPAESAQPASRREAVILELLNQGVSSSHDLIARSGLSAADFAHTISLMEITGKIRNLGAATWIRR